MEFRVYIRALEPNDYRTTIEWRQEDGLWDNFIGPKRFVSSDTEKRWVEKSILEHEKGERLRFAVCLKENDKLIGLITFSNIDLINGACEISRIIGKEHRSKGYYTEMSLLALKYIFDEYPIHRINSRLLVTNKRSEKGLLKFGFVKEGKMRKALYKNGHYIDLLIYGLLKKDFFNGIGKEFKEND